jgi:TnpA family transposase
MRSSSDGQRDAVERDGCSAAVYPCYFGYCGRVLQLDTHTSDQHSVYGTRAISCVPREAGYVLSSILDDDTTLAILLALVSELCKDAIDRVLVMTDLELGIQALLGTSPSGRR